MAASQAWQWRSAVARLRVAAASHATSGEAKLDSILQIRYEPAGFIAQGRR